MRKFNKKAIEQKWVEWEKDKEVQILVRPFPASQTMIMADMSKEERGSINWKIFDYCVLDWKGFVDENDKPLKCTKENKQMIFDYDREFIVFAVNEISNFDKDIIEQKKIL